MRITAMQFKSARMPQNENTVRFKDVLPLRLKESLSSKSASGKERGCWYELTTVLSCFKENNFENKYCSHEIEKFQNCYKSYLTNNKIRKQQQQKDIPVGGSSALTSKQLSYLLRKYPNV